jgi:hypothetical protein
VVIWYNSSHFGLNLAALADCGFEMRKKKMVSFYFTFLYQAFFCDLKFRKSHPIHIQCAKKNKETNSIEMHVFKAHANQLWFFCNLWKRNVLDTLHMYVLNVCPGVDVVITIFGDFGQFSAKKSDFCIIWLCFESKTPIFSPKNNNIGPWYNRSGPK